MQELSNWLGRVEAPAELWTRVAQPPLPDGRGSETALLSRDRKGAVAGLVAALAAAALLAFFFLPRTLHSSDPSQIHSWILSKSGIDVPLPAKLGPSARLISARMKDRSTAQIDYQVNGRDALLLVSIASAAVAGNGRHRSLRNNSWTMGGLVYTVICPSGEVAQVACPLCHSL